MTHPEEFPDATKSFRDDPAGPADPATLTDLPDPDATPDWPAEGEGSTLTPAGGGAGGVPAGPGQGGLRYRPIKLHKTGGLGQVWLARDTLLGRDVALKVVRPDRAAHAGLVDRFRREATVTAVLEHPGIVPLYDFVEGPGAWRGVPSYVMRFVNGGTLADATAAYHAARAAGAATPLAFRGLLDAFVAVCRAVAFAHSKGVLHRDLKGQNVVLGEFGEVFLLDWGLTKLSLRGNDPGLLQALLAADDTAVGVISGTPAYIAPEVAGGDEATTASDVYGLGGILYAILTGKAPAEGATPKEVLDKVRSADPPPPRHVNPAASRALEAVCRKAMARKPDNRYATAEELATEVRRWLADERVEAYAEPWADRAGRWARNHRGGVRAAAATALTVVAALVVGSGLLAVEERKTHSQAVVAKEQRDRAEANLDTAHSLAGEILRVTEKVLPGIDGSETKRVEIAAISAAAYRAFAAQRPESAELARTAARLTRVEANLLRLTGDHAGAERAYAQSLAADEAAGDEADPFHRPEALRDHASNLDTMGKPLAALAALDAAQQLIDAARAGDPNSVPWQRIDARLWLQRAQSELTMGRYVLAAASADRAAKLFGGLPASEANPYDGLQNVMAHGRRAEALCRGGLLSEARAEMAAAKKLLTPYTKPEPGKKLAVNVVDVASTQAAVLLIDTRISLAKGKDAKGIADRNLGEIARAYADLHTRRPLVPGFRGMLARTLVTRGEVCVEAGKPAEAAKHFSDAVGHLLPLTKDYPTRPEHRYDLGMARLGLSRVTGDQGERAKLKGQALADLGAACVASPDDVEFHDALVAAGG